MNIFRSVDGSEFVRDFIYIDDIVCGIIVVCDISEVSGKKVDGLNLFFRVYNFGNTYSVTVSDFVSKFEYVFGMVVKCNYLFMFKIGDVFYIYVNISVVECDLLYKFRVDFDIGF